MCRPSDCTEESGPKAWTPFPTTALLNAAGMILFALVAGAELRLASLYRGTPFSDWRLLMTPRRVRTVGQQPTFTKAKSTDNSSADMSLYYYFLGLSTSFCNIFAQFHHAFSKGQLIVQSQKPEGIAQPVRFVNGGALRRQKAINTSIENVNRPVLSAGIDVVFVFFRAGVIAFGLPTGGVFGRVASQLIGCPHIPYPQIPAALKVVFGYLFLIIYVQDVLAICRATSRSRPIATSKTVP